MPIVGNEIEQVLGVEPLVKILESGYTELEAKQLLAEFYSCDATRKTIEFMLRRKDIYKPGVAIEIQEVLDRYVRNVDYNYSPT